MSETELVLSREFASMPGVAEGLRRAQRIFDSIQSFEDIERVFLKGAGLSANTYRSYLGAVKQFHEWSHGKHPLTVTPADLEAFYDHLAAKVGKNTACLRIFGLKRFFAGIRAVLPIYTSPFEIMNEKLKRKLSRTKKGNRTRPALTAQELRDVLAWLDGLGTLRARQDRAMIYFLATSGLRAFEFCQLQWGSIQRVGDTLTALFTGKGDTTAEQELYAPAVEASAVVFAEQMKRQPLPSDPLFSTMPFGKTRQAAPMNYAVLYERLRQVGAAAREAGVITRTVTWSPHMMRRTYATGLMRAGMDLKSVQNKTRHANLETLARHYLDSSDPSTPFLDKMLGKTAA